MLEISAAKDDKRWAKAGLGVTQGHQKLYHQSSIHDFLLMYHSSHRPISYRFRDKQRFPWKIAKFSHPCVFTAPAEGVPLELGISARNQKSSNDGATRWLKKF